MLKDQNLQIIAFYLPQFHPTPHNNEWWGEGFTEWTNVAKAKPLFRGHYQPKIPADLGFYDLRMPEIKEKQVELAKRAGVTGFCYYHYWFGNGHQELELPFNQVVETGKPDFPFCLCWANETWSRKFWNKEGNVSEKQDLAVQQYLGEEDDRLHFQTLLEAFKDKRYYHIDGRLVFMIYRPLQFEEVERFMALWNQLAKENGLDGFYFIGYSLNVAEEHDTIINKGFDAVCSCHLGYGNQTKLMHIMRKVLSVFTNSPRKFSYKKMIPQLISKEDSLNDVFPTIIPNWDHTPRSKDHGYLYDKSTPELFEKHCKEVLEQVSKKQGNRQIVFLKSWNEWGEGNYMEPDLKYGCGYIDALKSAIKNVFNHAE